MSSWVIFQLPAVLILYCAAIALMLADRFLKRTRGILSYISVAAALICMGILLLFGGSLWEAAVLLLPFLLLTLGVDA